MTETTTAKKMKAQQQQQQLTISTKEISDLEFVLIVDTIEPGQWVEWEVRFYLDDERFMGFLQACPRHPQNFHHDVIEHCERY